MEKKPISMLKKYIFNYDGTDYEFRSMTVMDTIRIQMLKIESIFKEGEEITSEGLQKLVEFQKIMEDLNLDGYQFHEMRTGDFMLMLYSFLPFLSEKLSGNDQIQLKLTEEEKKKMGDLNTKIPLQN